MSKGFTPLIGLAVVVALALAAVFGALTIANPAMAAIGQPADSQLTETTDSPQAAPTGVVATQGVNNADPPVVQSGQIDLTWTTVSGLSNPEWQYRATFFGTQNYGNWTAIGNPSDDGSAGTTSGDNIQSLNNGQTYCFQLRYVQATVPSAASDDTLPSDGSVPAFCATPNFAPAGSVTAVTATKNTAEPWKIDLSWTWDQTDDNPAVETGWQYRYRLSEDTDTDTTGIQAADFTDSWADLTAALPPTGQAAFDGTATVAAPATGVSYDYQVRPVATGLELDTSVWDNHAVSEPTTASATADAAPLPLLTLGKITADAGDGQVRLSWDRVAAADHYVVTVLDGIDPVVFGAKVNQSPRATIWYIVDDLTNGTSYNFEVTAVAATGAGATHQDSATKTATATPAKVLKPIKPGLPSLTPGSDGSGSTTSYTVTFQVKDDDDNSLLEVNTREEDLVIEFQEDYQVPSTIRTASVAITTDTNIPGSGKDEVTFTPEDVTVDGNEIFISVGDIDERDDQFEYTFDERDTISVLFRQSAGISNPTAADDYQGIEAITFGAVEYDNSPTGFAENIPHSISIDPEDGGLGEVVTVKGKGFKNGTSMTFFRDANNDQKLTSADAVLCTDLMVEGNIGTCDFEVSHPTFTAGATNIINGVDGVNARASKAKAKTFELKASISTSPDGGSPGEMLLVQVVDFKGTAIDKVTIGGQIYCGGENPAGVVTSCSGGIDSAGSGNFSIEIPNWARGGLQELKVWDNAKPATSAATKVTLVGPQIRMTSQTVIANQRVSLIGTGFSPEAVIANVENLPAHHITPVISIGGDPIPQTRINDGDPVRVDNGGNWSASVDLPLSEATTAAGKREIRVMDSLARTGIIQVNIPGRVVTVTPDSGRVGTIALVQGTGFPSKNDEGSSFSIEIEYEAANGNTVTLSALTDASGRFEQQMRIPTTAAIPSSNQIHVRFDDDADITVPLTVPHNVPEGIITPSETSGGPGSTITISGEGFKSFVPVALVKIGTLDVTPSPKPSTDGNGMMEFSITIPGLDVGIQTIEVDVGKTTASAGFTVTESGLNPGDVKPTAEATEEIGENLVSVWHFNNDTKIWAFYDPALEEGNTLTHMITGETYLIRVSADQEVILNRDTRNLTCVGGNCWNQIVW